MNFSHNYEKYNYDDIEYVDYFAILTGREEVPQVYTLDTALATFQSQDNSDLKFSVKITEMSKIKQVNIDIGKSSEREEIVAELYKSETPSEEVTGKLCEGDICSQDLKGQLEGKDTKELLRKIEHGKAYVNILTEDKPNGKIRGKIKKLS
ncbi:MAG TPA: CHRD domain-containing protein [Nitrososphaeraceae archaeon]|nr:CHRD domain-containing protein [Nitrososphaeraceae archaeon]